MCLRLFLLVRQVLRVVHSLLQDVDWDVHPAEMIIGHTLDGKVTCSLYQVALPADVPVLCKAVCKAHLACSVRLGCCKLAHQLILVCCMC